MNPIDFPQAFRTLGAPAGVENVVPLRVWTDGRECISCWMPTEEERASISRGEPVFLRVQSGVTQPPVCLGVGSPFTSDASSPGDRAVLQAAGIRP